MNRPPRARRSRRSARPHGRPRFSDLQWGIAGLVLVVVIVAAFGVVYVVDIGTRTYSAQMPDAGSVRVGDEVRVAGIHVGNVESLELRPGHVAMTFTVDDAVFVGAQSTLSVRMLTIVGGHYVALIPAGTQPLGRTVIPADRVVLPYNLTEIFQDAMRPIEDIDGGVLRQNLGELAKAVDSSPQSFAAAVGAVNSIVSIMNKQNDEVTRSLALADEYLSALNVAKPVLVRAINALNLLENQVITYHVQVGESLRNTAAILAAVAPLGREWQAGNSRLVQQLRAAIPQLEGIGAELDDLLRSLAELGRVLEPIISGPGGVTIDQSAGVVAVAPCVPMAGRQC
ncbi:MlaD family protein [Nocardia sp. NPDC058379]|uniref:MlaD family protein n=1 Tax=unclassified Nocardia TaxID=2637762 RepID=UPI00365651CF